MSRSIAGFFRNQEITDLTLVCKDGQLVETHISLLAILSKELGELFTSLPSLPSMMMVPDVEKKAVEEVLRLYTKQWEEKRLNLEHIEVADLLGIPLISKSDKSFYLPRRTRSEQNMAKPETNLKKTMPSMLMRLKQEVKENLENTSDSELSEAETERNFDMNTGNTHPRVGEIVAGEEQALQELNDQIDELISSQSSVIGKSDDEGSDFKCAGCGTQFEERASLRLHIGEVHMEEEELEVQLSEAFPGGTFTCALCEEKCDSDYQMKEHIMLHHPCASLEALVVESEQVGSQMESEANLEDDKSNEEYEARPEKVVYKDMIAAETTFENWQDGIKEKKRKNSINNTNSDLKWACGTTYSCNYCDNIYNRIPLARSHILKIHKTKIERGDYPNHMSFGSKKYSCKICHQQIEHNPDNIRAHTLNKHRMKIHKYAASYEMTGSSNKRTRVEPYMNISMDPVIPKPSPGMETLPDEMKAFLNKIRAKTATVNGQIAKSATVNSKTATVNGHIASSAVVPPCDYLIEFSDSSDDEE